MSSSTSLAVPNVQRLQISLANLYYKTSADSDWVRLNPTPYSETYNVSDIDLKNTISIKQRFPGGAGTCTLILTTTHYNRKWINMDPKDTAVPDFWVDFDVHSPPSCLFTRTKAGNEDPHTLADFPLHQMAPSFVAIQLRLPQSKFKPSHDQAIMRALLSSLTSGDVSRIPGTDENVYVKDLMAGALAEQVAAQNALKSFKGCRIETKMFKRKMWVKIFPKGLPDKTDDDLERKATSLHYGISKSKLFGTSAEITRQHPNLFDRERQYCWSITLEQAKSSNAPFTGTIDNIFSASDFKQFEGVDEDVDLEPLFNDIGGDRGRAALRDFTKMLDDTAALLVGHFRPNSKESKLPIRELFLPGLKFVGTDNILGGVRRPLSNLSRSTLNESQCNAIEMARSKKVSIVWGPAATGKSEVLATLICQLHIDNPKEKTVVTAPTNVAVDQICTRLSAVWSRLMDRSTPPKMVRIYSEAEVQRQFRSDRKDIYEKETHIDKLRLGIARKSPSIYSGYLDGRSELIAHGAINFPAMWDKYMKQARALTNLVVDQMQAVFVTCDALRCGALRKVKNEVTPTGATKETVISWGATSCILDEAGCANPLQVLAAVTGFAPTLERFVLGGDHLQLPPYIESDEAKKLWPKSVFKDCIDKGVDYTQLTMQYRSHSRLNAAANHVIYDDKVSAFWDTAQPRPYLAHLLANMPLTFTADQRSYKLLSFSHFIDVSYGAHQSRPKGSSCNEAEVKVIQSLIKAFLSIGKPLETIAVVTGYLWQLELLQKMAATNNWTDLQLVSADTCQGGEWDILIVSLVKTAEPPGFIGNLNRANVVTTRAKEARYFVGNWTTFWHRRADKRLSGFETMHLLLQHMLHNSGDHPFVVHPS
ncbi:MAG: hypothetical protein Q9219_001775 [cf. Caloplaca sp. 3 TL-2023]